ncbi:flagellar hook-associated protein FlgK [Naasia aerilata]|uniref:Flagellar hook-associated protein 1 n=1 Tax=Naasia aerilata TaxID=1162966 RepID=A0ABM8GA91_9MICO|nr:flagellar basal body rod C-terminal domain-containing protein [Naasia aerilata]BDZ45110.1 flagellar hook-associated protein FlgK [Naasia aerilata]
MSKFWDAWQNVANNPGVPGQASTLLAQAGQTVSAIATGYTQASAGWADARTAAQTTVDTINDAAAQVAQLNDQIRRTVASDGNANELLDQRSVLVTGLAGLTGATVRDNGDSTIDLVLGGNSLVSGTSARKLALVGAARVEDAAATPVHVEWAGSSVAVDVEGGELAGRLATLAGAQPGGNGGPWAESAALYNRLATSLAATVNGVHSTGVTPSGAPGGAFFALAGALPAALGLSVVPTGVSGIAAAAPGKGGSDGTIADAISRLGTSPTGPDAVWSTYVIQVGVLSRAATQQAVLSTQATTVATTAQTSQSAVDIDEETTNLLMYQHAYQSAARMLTTVDEMLDTLINRTGLVGR